MFHTNIQYKPLDKVLPMFVLFEVIGFFYIQQEWNWGYKRFLICVTF